MSVLGLNKLKTYRQKLEGLCLEPKDCFLLAGRTGGDAKARAALKAEGLVKLLRARDYFQEINREFSPHRLAGPFLARSVNALIDLFILAERIDEAQKLYELYKSYGASPEVINLRVQSFGRLITSLAKKRRLKASEDLYRDLLPWGDEASLAVARIKVLFYLLTGFIQGAQTAKAQAVYDELMERARPFLLPEKPQITLIPAKGSSGAKVDSPRPLTSAPPTLTLAKSPLKAPRPSPKSLTEIRLIVAKASLNLIACYVLDGPLAQAEGVYANFSLLGAEGQEYIARATSDMAFSYARDGRWALARKFYSLLCSQTPDDDSDRKPRTAANMAVLFSEGGLLDQAKIMVGEMMATWGPDKHLDDKVRAIVSSLLAYLEGGRWSEAVGYYQSLPNLGQGLALEGQAKVAQQLLAGLAQEGRYALAQKVYEDFWRFKELPNYLYEAAKATLAMVDVYSRAKLSLKANERHNYLIGLEGSPEIDLLKARSFFVRVTSLAADDQVDEALAVYGRMATLPPSPGVEGEKSKCLVNLISRLGSKDNFAAAFRLFQSFNRLTPSDLVADNQALAAYNLLGDHLRLNQLAKAQELYLFLSRKAAQGVAPVLKVEAGLNIIQAAVALGRLKLAEAIFLSLKAQETGDFLAEKTQAAVILINAATARKVTPKIPKAPKTALSLKERLAIALKVYQALDGLIDDHSPNLGPWAGALVNLITALEAGGLKVEAQKAHESLISLKPTPEVKKELVKETFNRITYRARQGQVAEALKLLGDLEKLVEREGERPRLAEAMVNVVSALGQAGRLEEARRVFETARRLGPTETMLVYRAKMLYNLFLSYFKAGYLKDAALLFAQFQPGPELAEVKPALLDAALELILSLSGADSMGEAQTIHQTVKRLLGEPELTAKWPPLTVILGAPTAARSQTAALARILALGLAARPNLTKEAVSLAKDPNSNQSLKPPFLEPLVSAYAPENTRPNPASRRFLKPWLFEAFRS
ncbi:MAG: hypothetical protein LBS60_14990 [Deltaproteobacteria bacterium]|jgi:tetratricopeptide (TPR) repeat protein|nr:hypothetical protein [Deltaproteobacteria bacterium]